MQKTENTLKTWCLACRYNIQRSNDDIANISVSRKENINA